MLSSLFLRNSRYVEGFVSGLGRGRTGVPRHLKLPGLVERPPWLGEATLDGDYSEMCTHREYARNDYIAWGHANLVCM